MGHGLRKIDSDWADATVVSLVGGGRYSSSTPLYLRQIRRIFGCRHKYINTIPRSTETNIQKGIYYPTSTIKDWFCPKCWSVLDDVEYKQSIRDKKLKSIL